MTTVVSKIYTLLCFIVKSSYTLEILDFIIIKTRNYGNILISQKTLDLCLLYRFQKGVSHERELFLKEGLSDPSELVLLLPYN